MIYLHPFDPDLVRAFHLYDRDECGHRHVPSPKPERKRWLRWIVFRL